MLNLPQTVSIMPLDAWNRDRLVALERQIQTVSMLVGTAIL
ncbi:hypothetical protein [Zarconia navalis]|nr:hypothetical protein [Zarconia navalis]